MKKAKKISMGVLASVVVATPMIAISCGDNNSSEKEQLKREKQRQENKKHAAELRKIKEEKERKAKEAEQKAEKERIAKEKANLAEERDYLQDSVYKNLKKKVEDFINDPNKNIELDTLKKASEIKIDSLIDLEEKINVQWSLNDDFDASFMTISLITTGDSTGLITIEITLVTKGATNPTSKSIKLTIQHISDAEVKKNVEWDNQRRAEAEKKQAENRAHEKEMIHNGYERIGDTYEVWYDKKTKTFIDEYEGNWNLHELTRTNEKRYTYGLTNIFDHYSSMPIEHIIVPNATSLSGYLADDASALYGSHFLKLNLKRTLKSFKAKKATKITSGNLFENFINPINKVMPNIKN
ncbi:hypothetical protein [Mycoplasma todarodis]|uniref:Lipoprotein n=1 Tax=Mycoplasma todarodis TaxID=1937191 RepID=A0A4R0XMK7_9MOLU|nr:hypothetical protein [Mycoplasma todarodis]TCG11953.1 hypothetical protein C4B25_00415 [Mycoplasma todarodis]